MRWDTKNVMPSYKLCANLLDEWITIFFNHNYFDYLLNVSTAICSFHQEFWDGKFFLCSPVVIVSRPSHTWLILYSPRVSIHDWSCLSDPYVLFDPSCVSVTLCKSLFAPSQSMIQLFLSAWSVIADLCSIIVDTLFCSLVNRLVVMFSTSFLYSSSLVPNVLPVSPIYVWLQLFQGIWYTQSRS